MRERQKSVVTVSESKQAAISADSHRVDDVIILNADFKWKEGKLSILEIADGISNSGYTGYNVLHGTHRKDEAMFRMIFNKLALRFQTIYVIHHTTKGTVDQIPVEQLNKNIKVFDTYFEFIDYIKSKKTNNANGLLVVGETLEANPVSFAPRSISEVKIFLQKQGINIPVVNSTEMFKFADDKIIFNMVCPGGVPNSFIVGSDNVLEKINLFLLKSASAYIVLKPPAQQRGEGVKVISRDTLIALQSELQRNKSNIPQIPIFSDLLEQYGHFLIQDYIESTEVLVKGSPYDPTATGRAVLILYKTATDSYEVEFVDAYWKLPKISKKRGICEASQISYIGEGTAVSSVVLTETHKAEITAAFKAFFQCPINMFLTSMDFLMSHHLVMQDDEQKYFRHQLEKHGIDIASLDIFNRIQKMRKRFSFRFDKILLKSLILMIQNNHLESLNRPDLVLCTNEIKHLLSYLTSEKCSNKLILPSTSLQQELAILSLCPDSKKLIDKIKQSESNLKRILKKYKLIDDSPSELAKGLRRAATFGETDDLSLFLEIVEDINEQDSDAKKGYTALHWAVEKKHYSCVEILLSSGAKFTLKNASGKTVQEMIEESENTTLKELLAMVTSPPQAIVSDPDQKKAAGGGCAFLVSDDEKPASKNDSRVDRREKSLVSDNTLEQLRLELSKITVERDEILALIEAGQGSHHSHLDKKYENLSAQINDIENQIASVSEPDSSAVIYNTQSQTESLAEIKLSHSANSFLNGIGESSLGKPLTEDAYSSLPSLSSRQNIPDSESPLLSPDPSCSVNNSTLMLPSQEIVALNPSSFHSYPVSNNIKNLLKKYGIIVPTPSQSDVEKLLRTMVVNHPKVKNWKDDLEVFTAESKTDINAKNKDGKTALHLAVERNHIDYVKALLEKNADCSLIDTSKGPITPEILMLFSSSLFSSPTPTVAID